MLLRSGYNGFKADMWSAGVCLYGMIVGCVPFKASSMTKLHDLIKTANYDYEY
jgi:serine/threonine protein kinase